MTRQKSNEMERKKERKSVFSCFVFVSHDMRDNISQLESRLSALCKEVFGRLFNVVKYFRLENFIVFNNIVIEPFFACSFQIHAVDSMHRNIKPKH